MRPPDWRDVAPTPPRGEPMEPSRLNFYKMMLLDAELILDMKDEISKLKMQVNNLQQKLKKQEDN